MRRLLPLLLSLNAFAGSPLIWKDGNFGQNLAKEGLYFNFSDSKVIRRLTVDPSAGGGVTAAIGSFGLRDNTGVGELWLKTGAANTAWSLSGMAIGSLVTGATQGSILFAGAGGVLAQDNSSFYFDDTNNRLGLLTTSPQATLDIKQVTSDYSRWYNSQTNYTLLSDGSVVKSPRVSYSTETSDTAANKAQSIQSFNIALGGSYGGFGEYYGSIIDSKLTEGGSGFTANKYVGLLVSTNDSSADGLNVYSAGIESKIIHNSSNSGIGQSFLSSIEKTSGTGDLSSAIGFTSSLNHTTTTMNAFKGFQVEGFVNSSTITNTYGFYVGDITSGTQTNTPYSFYASDGNAYNYFSGATGFGSVTSPTASIDSSGDVRIRTLTTAGVVINAASGLLSTETQLAITRGGTGQSTANAAFNALAPAQAINSGKFLTTNGTDTSWGVPTDTGITQLTSDVTAGPGSGSQVATIALNAVTNAKMVQVATQTFKGRTAAGTGDVEDLTATQATAILNSFAGDSGSGAVKGLVPAAIAGDATKFLRGDATWQTVSAGITELTSDVTAGPGSGSQAATIANNAVTNAKAAQMAAHTFKGNNTASTANALDLTATQLTAELNVFGADSGSGGVKGLVPATIAGDATKFLKGDGTWSSALSSLRTVTNTSASPGNITAAGGITTTAAVDQDIYVQGNGGAITVTANPQISAGTVDGQRLCLIAKSDSNTLTISDGTGLSLNGTWVGSLNSTICLRWDLSTWTEISRSN